MSDMKSILRQYDKAKTENELFRNLMTEVYTFAIPSRNTWVIQTEGSRQDIQIFNSHPVNSVKLFASNIVNLLAPVGLKFFDLESHSKNMQDKEEIINKILTEVSDKLFDYIGVSSIYLALHESCMDLAAGTGAILLNYSGDEDNPLSFISIDNSAISFTENSNGIIGNVFRCIEKMDRTIAEVTYPDANFSTFKEDEDISMIEAIIYNESNKKYKHLLFQDNSDVVYFEEELNTNPFIIFRWSKMPSEIRGRGIVTDMIGSIRTANIMAMDILSASSRLIAPPLVVNQNSLVNPSNIDISPNSVISINAQPGISNPIQSLPFTGNLPFGVAEIDRMNAELDKALLVNPLGEVGDATQTATEVTARLKIAANTLGTFYGRAQKELLEPIIMRSIDILTKANLIVAPKKFKICYKSPIQHLQDQFEVSSLLKMVQSLAEITGDNSALAINTALEITKLPNWLADKLGVDKTMIKTTDEIISIMGQIQKVQQDQAIREQQAMSQGSGGNPALQEPINTGVA